MGKPYPHVSIIGEAASPHGPGVRVLTHFDSRPASFMYSPVQSGKYGRERASCAAVIRAAKRKQWCADDTEVAHIRRRRGVTRVMIVSMGAPARPVRRTGLSRDKDHCLAAAEACLDALLSLPAPDPGCVQFRVCL